MGDVNFGSAEAAAEVLDLYSFYKEVTARGGFEQVIKEKKWDEVAHALNLACNVPDLSFALQKNYADLLYPFEQVFHFHMPHPPLGILPALVTLKDSSTQHKNQGSSSRKRKRRRNPNLPSKGTKKKGSLVGKTLSGSIRTEFHGGYLVTVELGSELLNGLLCHEPGSGEKPSATSGGDGGCVKLDGDADRGKRNESVGMEVSRVKASRKRERRDGKRDRDAPLGVRTAYHFFYAAQSERLKKKTKGEGSSGGTRKLVTELWKSLSQIDKMPYIEMSLQDKARHRREMQAYEEQQKELPACKMHHKDENTSNMNGVGIDPMDEQSEQAKLHPYYQQEDDDCYRVSLDMDAEAGDAAGVPADVQAFVDDVFCSGCLMDDSELLAYVGSAWSGGKDVSGYLPSFNNAT
ncbi:High mobility group B protein 9 [Nymphaea thermarum]|nr:High mobility group B protein 9 [Nymphaea thermarum]